MPPVRRGTPLNQRPVSTGADGDPTAHQARVSRQPRHCWVSDPQGGVGRHPGLLIAWRRSTSGDWDALVVYALLDNAEPVLVQQWLNARRVSPTA
jgi:hypothetical protein